MPSPRDEGSRRGAQRWEGEGIGAHTSFGARKLRVRCPVGRVLHFAAAGTELHNAPVLLVVQRQLEGNADG